MALPDCNDFNGCECFSIVTVPAAFGKMLYVLSKPEMCLLINVDQMDITLYYISVYISVFSSCIVNPCNNFVMLSLIQMNCAFLSLLRNKCMDRGWR